MHDAHSLWTFLDQAVEHHAAAERAGILAAAQAEFQRRTGDYEPGQPWYEERIRLFHDWFLLDAVQPDGRVPLARYVEEAGDALTAAQRAVYRDLLRASHRSLFEIDRSRGRTLRLLDRIGGAVFEVPMEAGLAGLATCDLLDARLLSPGGMLVLARGLLVHPRPAHDMILDVVRHGRAVAGGAPWELLDILARMKAAWDRAENPRVAAIYGPGSYLFREFTRSLAGTAAPDGMGEAP
jgi:hypothetical protein